MIFTVSSLEIKAYGGVLMDTKTCIKTRRSVRKFTDAPVSEEVIKELVGCAAYAPSWKNSLAEECCAEHNAGIINGSAALVATLIVDKRSGFERDGSFSTVREDNWQAFDNGIATQTFCLAAAEEGLGTVIMGLYDIEKASNILQVPEGQLLMALIAVGHPADEPEAPKRKTVEDLLTIK